MKLTTKTGDLIGVVMVDDEMDLMALTSSGNMIRVDMQSIRKAGRNTSGVIVVKVSGDEVVSIATCPKAEDVNDENSDESGLFDNNTQNSSEQKDENLKDGDENE